ncbi:MAG: AAA family ATPase, partial [Geminicoccaceae bacterium]|nr:AAA family ATPase [Geminicoccaceae bacterium]
MPEARTGSERVLRRLEIRRFRGIRGLVLDELPPVTVLTGRNGCGKTSVLEAAFLLCGLSNASLVFSSASFRGLPVVAGADTPFRAL